MIRTDRLYVDHDYVYAWSERNQRIERWTNIPLIKMRTCCESIKTSVNYRNQYLFNCASFCRLTTSSTCGSGNIGTGGGLATAAAERSMLRTPALRYADRLMEMDEDEIMT